MNRDQERAFLSYAGDQSSEMYNFYFHALLTLNIMWDSSKVEPENQDGEPETVPLKVNDKHLQIKIVEDVRSKNNVIIMDPAETLKLTSLSDWFELAIQLGKYSEEIGVPASMSLIKFIEDRIMFIFALGIQESDGANTEPQTVLESQVAS